MINEYWRWENEIKPDVCQRLINLAEDNWVSAETDDVVQNPDIRKGQTFFTSEEWIYDIFFPYMLKANENAEWKFDVSSSEPCQISKYNTSDHYSFHMDSLGTWPTKFNCPEKPFIHGKTRKISMTCSLNKDFEGGELEFVNDYSLDASQGTIIFFPSFMQHRVKPITKGTRYSLVLWFLGEPWR